MSRARNLGAVFFETAGWERPFWYESNRNLLDRYGHRVLPRSSEWDSRWWSPIINAEHLAMRDNCGVVDLSAFAVLDLIGPGALTCLQSLAVAQLDVAIGKVVYTSMLDQRAGFVADLTVMRLDDGGSGSSLAGRPGWPTRNGSSTICLRMARLNSPT